MIPPHMLEAFARVPQDLIDLRRPAVTCPTTTSSAETAGTRSVVTF